MSGFRNPLTPERLQTFGELLDEQTFTTTAGWNFTTPIDKLAGHSTLLWQIEDTAGIGNFTYHLSASQNLFPSSTSPLTRGFGYFEWPMMAASFLGGFPVRTDGRVFDNGGAPVTVTTRIYGFRQTPPETFTPLSTERIVERNIAAGATDSAFGFQDGPAVRNFSRIRAFITSPEPFTAWCTFIDNIGSASIAYQFRDVLLGDVTAATGGDPAGQHTALFDIPFMMWPAGLRIRNDGAGAANGVRAIAQLVR